MSVLIRIKAVFANRAQGNATCGRFDGRVTIAISCREYAMNEWSYAKLCDVANLILGLFLALSPWFVDYSGRPAQNAVIAGLVIAGLSIAALAAFAQWEEWLNLLLGLWVLVSPWALGFQGTTAAWVHIVVGILVAALAAIELWLTQQTPQVRH
jgi:hypothetical protein